MTCIIYHTALQHELYKCQTDREPDGVKRFRFSYIFLSTVPYLKQVWLHIWIGCVKNEVQFWLIWHFRNIVMSVHHFSNIKDFFSQHITYSLPAYLPFWIGKKYIHVFSQPISFSLDPTILNRSEIKVIL